MNEKSTQIKYFLQKFWIYVKRFAVYLVVEIFAMVITDADRCNWLVAQVNM